MGRDLAIGIDLGGTQLRAAIVSSTGEIISRAATATDAAGGPAAVIGQIRGLCGAIGVNEHRDGIAGVGVSAPGPLDSETGMIIAIPTLPGWEDFPLATVLASDFGMAVVVENDGIAAANGEWRYGNARGLRHFVYVTVSTGIGGGVVVDDRLLHGARGMAGHVGHMVIDPQGPSCSCGARGCFEALASGSALGLAGHAAATSQPTSSFASHCAGRPVTGPLVVEAARNGDPTALALLAQEARFLGLGFSNLAHLYSPQAIIMGGGVSNAFDLLSDTINATVQATAMAPFRSVRIVPAALGDNAGIVGAAALLWDKEGNNG